MVRTRNRLIGFDLDGVLVPWHEVVRDYMIKTNFISASVSLGDLFGNCSNDPKSIFNNLSKSLQSTIVKNPKFYDVGRISSHNLKVLNTLAKSFELIYITSRPKLEAEAVTKSWMGREKLPYSSNTWVVEGSKAEIIGEFPDLFCYVDDRPKAIDDIKELVAVFVYDRPWNKDYPIDKSKAMRRIYDLEEVIKLVRR